MMPPHDPRRGLDIPPRSGEDPLPCELARGSGKLSIKGVGKHNGAVAGLQVAIMQSLHFGEVYP